MNIPPANTHTAQAPADYELCNIQSTLMALSILGLRLLDSAIMHCTAYISGDR